MDPFTTATVETLTVGQSVFTHEQRYTAWESYESRQRFLRNPYRLGLHHFVVFYVLVVLFERVLPVALYEAVSYAWGDGHDRKRIISNGVWMFVKRSLSDALQVFRHSLGPGTSEWTLLHRLEQHG